MFFLRFLKNAKNFEGKSSAILKNQKNEKNEFTLNAALTFLPEMPV